jgi:hypothetical protein
LFQHQEFVRRDEEIQGLRSPFGELTSSHEARVSDLMEVNADLQRQQDAKDAERDAAVGAAQKAERERAAPRRKRDREVMRRRCDELEAQCDDFQASMAGDRCGGAQPARGG